VLFIVPIPASFMTGTSATSSRALTTTKIEKTQEFGRLNAFHAFNFGAKMIKQSRRASTFTTVNVSNPKLSAYPFTLNFYDEPPPYELTLDEFESFSIDRLKVLKAFETAKLRSKKDDEAFKAVESVVSEFLELSRNTVKGKSNTLYDQRRKDHISHFLLRLAFCRSEELRNWLVRYESLLFKFRYMKEEPADREAFLSSVHLDATPIGFEGMYQEFYPHDHKEPESIRSGHKTRLLNDIKTVYSLDSDMMNVAMFYKVPFEQVVELVSKRACLLRDGWAYVPEFERILLVLNAFKKTLMRGLEETARALPRMEDDDRYVFFSKKID
jgi:DNA primase large subunit